MKAASIVAILFFFTVYSYSQNLDLVISTQGDTIVCKIDSITESLLYYHIVQKTGGVQYGMPLNMLQSYSYNTISDEQYTYKNGIATFSSFDKESYKYLKSKYVKQPYSYNSTDKYSPQAAGFMALIPSVGHIYTGEPLRGIVFLGGMAGSFGLYAYGFSNIELFGGKDETLPGIAMITGFVGFVVFYIWNIVDAVQVAKVKNLAIRNNDISLKILPNFEFPTAYNQLTNNVGVRLVLSF